MNLKNFLGATFFILYFLFFFKWRRNENRIKNYSIFVSLPFKKRKKKKVKRKKVAPRKVFKFVSLSNDTSMGLIG